MNACVTGSMTEVGLAARASRGHGAPRVLFVSASRNGMETYARALAERTRRRGDIEAFHLLLEPARLMRLLGAHVPLFGRGNDLQRARYAVMWRCALGAMLRRWAPLREFDLIHALTSTIGGPFISSLGGRNSRRVVLNIDATSDLEVRDFGASALCHALLRTSEHNALVGAGAVACWSEWAARSVREDHGVPASRVLVAPPGVEPGRPGLVRQEGEPLRIAFVGHDFQRKGGDALVRLHAARWRGRVELHLFSRGAPVVASEGVVSHGAVPHAELLRRHLPRMHLLALPTREDTLGIAILEAGAAGVPAIASRLAGIPELIRDRCTGILVPPGDARALCAAVESLLDDECARAAMGRRAAEHVRVHFNAVDLYDRLIDRLCSLATNLAVSVRESTSVGPAVQAVA